MRSIEQLAQAGYEAFQKKIAAQVEGHRIAAWSKIDRPRREAWIAAAQSVRAEIEAVH